MGSEKAVIGYAKAVLSSARGEINGSKKSMVVFEAAGFAQAVTLMPWLVLRPLKRYPVPSDKIKIKSNEQVSS